MSMIERNSRVTLYYRLGTIDGQILEDNFDEEPMKVTLGRGEMAEGLELALIGLRAGDVASGQHGCTGVRRRGAAVPRPTVRNPLSLN